MKAIAQNEIIALVSDINAFADRAEHLINTTQATYDRDKITLQSRHKNAVASLDSNYKNSCASIRTRSQRTINDARAILQEITKLDQQLSSVDKYYVKTKKKKEESLSDTTSSKYEGATDYFDTLAKIKESFNVLYKKYSEDILPALINGLNYLLFLRLKENCRQLRKII